MKNRCGDCLMFNGCYCCYDNSLREKDDIVEDCVGFINIEDVK